ncbi:MAG TPA: hypothetical protein VGJ17_01120, partial [Candidatus Limnocylindrales bacterium]
TSRHDFASIDGVYALLRPKSGSAKPSAGAVTADFPGHVIVDMTVPKGGPGAFSVGVHTPQGDVPLPFAGTGPPSDAPLAKLLTATFHDVVGTPIADRPFEVSVDAEGRGLWDLDAVNTDAVFVIASRPGQPDAGTAKLSQPGGAGTPFSGELTIAGGGEATLTAAIRASDGSTQVIDGSPAAVNVVAGAHPSPTAGPVDATPSPEPGVSPLIWLALIVVAVLIVGWLVLTLRGRPDQPSLRR